MWRKYCPISWMLCWWFKTQKPRWLWNSEWSGDWMATFHYHFCPILYEAFKESNDKPPTNPVGYVDEH